MLEIRIALIFLLTVTKLNSALAQEQITTCPNQNVFISSNISGQLYSWEMFNGESFVDIGSNNTFYSIKAKVLEIKNIPSSLNGSLIRCHVNDEYSAIYRIQIMNTWVGGIDSLWNNPLNWECNQIPDLLTDVKVSSFVERNVYISEDAQCNRIDLDPNKTLIIAPGKNLKIHSKESKSIDYNIPSKELDFLDTIGVVIDSPDKILLPDGTALNAAIDLQDVGVNNLANLYKILFDRAFELVNLKTKKVYSENEGGAGPEQFGLAYNFGGNDVSKRSNPPEGDSLHKVQPTFGTDCSGFIQDLFKTAGFIFKARLTTSRFKEIMQDALDKHPDYNKYSLVSYKMLPENQMQGGDIILWPIKGHVGLVVSTTIPTISKIIWQSNGQPWPLTTQGGTPKRTDLEEQARNLSLSRGVKALDFQKAITDDYWGNGYEILRLETLIDARDNKQYKIRQYGNTLWMTENLDYVVAGSYCYQNSQTYCDLYGRLYDWSQAQNARITGWRLPTDNDFIKLAEYVVNENQRPFAESFAGAYLKAKGLDYWQLPNKGANDKSGFLALPAGNRNTFGTYFGNLGYRGFWWTSTNDPANNTRAIVRSVDNESTILNKGAGNKDAGRAHFSVRLVKDVPGN